MSARRLFDVGGQTEDFAIPSNPWRKILHLPANPIHETKFVIRLQPRRFPGQAAALDRSRRNAFQQPGLSLAEMDFSAIHRPELESPRAQIRALCVRGLYAQAAELARVASDEVLIFTPCEAIADHLRATRPAEAARLYALAAQKWEYEGSQATGSGEGLLAMDHLITIKEKLQACTPEHDTPRPAP